MVSNSVGFLKTCMLIVNAVVIYGHPKLPEEMPLCKRNDPNLNECLKSAIQTSVSVLANVGIPELDVPSIDPLHIHEILVHQNSTHSVRISLALNHADVIGLSNIEIQSVDADWDKCKIRIDMKSSPLMIVGDYKVDGKIMVLPIFGEGKFNFSFNEGGEGHIELSGRPEVRDGKTYMITESVTWDYKPNHLFMNLDNLFNGDKARGIQMNAFLNDNWEDVLDEVKDVTQASFGDTFKDIAKLIFDKVPLDSIAIE
ncbi:protein takeout [Nilaparvata lugens]|uniref:protein takeout n=1 Tax=Nilaparvata lugens TaxID=108931 RepID=UPI000B98E2A7|nr:protein takeout [Nilaparvata lugens]